MFYHALVVYFTKLVCFPYKISKILLFFYYYYYCGWSASTDNKDWFLRYIIHQLTCVLHILKVLFFFFLETDSSKRNRRGPSGSQRSKIKPCSILTQGMEKNSLFLLLNTMFKLVLRFEYWHSKYFSKAVLVKNHSCMSYWNFNYNFILL